MGAKVGVGSIGVKVIVGARVGVGHRLILGAKVGITVTGRLVGLAKTDVGKGATVGEVIDKSR